MSKQNYPFFGISLERSDDEVKRGLFWSFKDLHCTVWWGVRFVVYNVEVFSGAEVC